jgi:hypothetical protein
MYASYARDLHFPANRTISHLLLEQGSTYPEGVTECGAPVPGVEDTVDAGARLCLYHRPDCVPLGEERIVRRRWDDCG